MPSTEAILSPTNQCQLNFEWGRNHRWFQEKSTGHKWKLNLSGQIEKYSCQNSEQSFTDHRSVESFGENKQTIFYNGRTTLYRGLPIKREMPDLLEESKNNDRRYRVGFDFHFGTKVSSGIYYNHFSEQLLAFQLETGSEGLIEKKKWPLLEEEYFYNQFEQIYKTKKSFKWGNKNFEAHYELNEQGEATAIRPFVSSLEKAQETSTERKSNIIYDEQWQRHFHENEQGKTLTYLWKRAPWYQEKIAIDAQGNVTEVVTQAPASFSQKKNYSYNQQNELQDRSASKIPFHRNELGQVDLLEKSDHKGNKWRWETQWYADRPVLLEMRKDDEISSSERNRYQFYYDEEDKLLAACPQYELNLSKTQGFSERCFVRNGEESFSYQGHQVHLIKGQGIPLAIIIDGQQYRLITNYQGSVVGMMTLEGQWLWWRDYSAWGEKTAVHFSIQGKTVEEREELDKLKLLERLTIWSYAHLIEIPLWNEQAPLIQLYWSTTRVYSPHIQEWLSVDPLLKWKPQAVAMCPENWDPFRYALNNPTTYTDPSGEFVHLAVIVGSAIIGGTVSVIMDRISQKKEGFNFFRSFARGFVIGGVSSVLSPLTFGVGSSFATGIGISSTTNSVLHNVVAQGVGHGLSGMAMGAVSTMYNSAVQGKRLNWQVMKRNMIQSGKIGAITGAIHGGLQETVAKNWKWYEDNGNRQTTQPGQTSANPTFQTSANNPMQGFPDSLGNLDPVVRFVEEIMTVASGSLAHTIAGENYHWRYHLLNDLVTYNTQFMAGGIAYAIGESIASKRNQEKAASANAGQMIVQNENNENKEDKYQDPTDAPEKKDTDRDFIIEPKKDMDPRLHVVSEKTMDENRREILLDLMGMNHKPRPEAPLVGFLGKKDRLTEEDFFKFLEANKRDNYVELEDYDLNLMEYGSVKPHNPFTPKRTDIATYEIGLERHPFMDYLKYLKREIVYPLIKPEAVTVNTIMRHTMNYLKESYREIAPDVAMYIGFAATSVLEKRVDAPSHLKAGASLLAMSIDIFSNTRYVCFPAGTPVWTPKGNVAIETIQAEESVWTYDLKWKQRSEQRVRELKEYTSIAFVYLTFENGEELKVTPEHPFYTMQDGGSWILAENLKVKDEIYSGYGRSSKIAHVRYEKLKDEQAEKVYNVLIHNNNNYFAGFGHYLVHNCGRVPWSAHLNNDATTTYEAYHFFQTIAKNWEKIAIMVPAIAPGSTRSQHIQNRYKDFMNELFLQLGEHKAYKVLSRAPSMARMGKDVPNRFQDLQKNKEIIHKAIQDYALDNYHTLTDDQLRSTLRSAYGVINGNNANLNAHKNLVIEYFVKNRAQKKAEFEKVIQRAQDKIASNQDIPDTIGPLDFFSIGKTFAGVTIAGGAKAAAAAMAAAGIGKGGVKNVLKGGAAKEMGAAGQAACFPGETLVCVGLEEAGEEGSEKEGLGVLYKKIKKLKVGDQVVSCNFEENICEYQPVEAISKRKVSQLVALTVGEQEQVLEVTPEHPFYVADCSEIPKEKIWKKRQGRSGFAAGFEGEEGTEEDNKVEEVVDTLDDRDKNKEKGCWVEAQHLEENYHLRMISGRDVVVARVDWVEAEKGRNVYNLTVGGKHNFFVGVGSSATAVCVHNCKKAAPEKVIENAGKIADAVKVKVGQGVAPRGVEKAAEVAGKVEVIKNVGEKGAKKGVEAAGKKVKVESIRPKSLQDEMALKRALEHPVSERIFAEAEKDGLFHYLKKVYDVGEMGNLKFREMQKWEYVFKSNEGKTSVIHYIYDPKTGKIPHYKFKQHSTGEILK